MPNKGPDPTVSDEELIEIIKKHDTPVASAGTVAERVKISRQSCDRRLKTMAEEEKIKQGQIGDWLNVYWVEESERESRSRASCD